MAQDTPCTGNEGNEVEAPLLETAYQLCFSTVKSEDSEPKNVTLYITELFSAGIWLHRLGSKWTITKGLEMFIILIRLLLNVSRHNTSTFLIISLYCNNNHMWEIVTS